MNILDVKIGYKNYKVEITKEPLYLEGRRVYGTANHDEGLIQISSSDNLSIDQQNCTFIHEVIHGMDDFLDIELSESQVEKLGKAFYLFIKENPGVFEN